MRRAVTLIELLMTIIISGVAVLALAIPVVAERRFWTTGRQQTQAQRDAQMAMRAIASVARESSSARVLSSGPGDGKIEFAYAGCAKHIFEGGPDVGSGAQKGWLKSDKCGTQTTLINPSSDKSGSRMTRMEVAEVEDDRLVWVRIEVTNRNGETELLESTFALRNGA